MSRATVVRRVCSLKTPRHQILTGNFHEYAQRELTDGWTKSHNWCRRLHRSARGVSVFAQSSRGWFRPGFPRISNVSVFVSKRVVFAPIFLTPLGRQKNSAVDDRELRVEYSKLSVIYCGLLSTLPSLTPLQHQQQAPRWLSPSKSSSSTKSPSISQTKSA
jgi:hypothetical protein